MTVPSQQLHAIHSMLTAGQRNLRLERHTLWLWEVPAGMLFVLSEHILTPEQFPDLTQRALAWLALLLTVLATVATLDWHWTRQAKQTRDEAWSFIHRQVVKVLWLLMGLATLTTFAMFFYGGGYMVCAVWLVFLGVSLYLHGLFSEELLEWAGLLTIALGIVSLLARLPYDSMRWVAAAVFGLGLPMLSLMLDHGRHRPASLRLGQMLAWLSVVVLAPLTLDRLLHQTPPIELPITPLHEFHQSQPGAQVVRLPVGTVIPVQIELAGDVFASPSPVQLPLTLRQPVDVLLKNGQLSGEARIPGEPWLRRDTRWLNIPWLKADLPPGGQPAVRTQLIVRVGGQP